jgi:hypothetical protein
MSQTKAVFLLPRRDNDGRDLSAELRAAEAELLRRFGRWTLMGVARGTYTMPDGTTAEDESNEYALVLDPGRVPEVEQVLREFKAKTKQESIYLELTPDVQIRYVK